MWDHVLRASEGVQELPYHLASRAVVTASVHCFRLDLDGKPDAQLEL
jgi:aminoglycoside phosphotransferase family enzyme